jgi:hypothetical protein
MKRSSALMFFATAATCMLLSACGSDDDPKTKPNDVTEIIGTAGGTLTSSDDNLEIDIPAGVMDDGTSVTVTVNESNAHPDGVGTMFTLESEVDEFDEPVTLTFAYTDDMLPPGALPEFLTVAFREDGGAWTKKANGVLNKTSKTITVQTYHFSQWSLAFTGEGYMDFVVPIDTFEVNIPADRLTNANGSGDYGDSLLFYFEDEQTLYKSVLHKIGSFELTVNTEVEMALSIRLDGVNVYSGTVDVVFTSLGKDPGDIMGGTFSGDIQRISDKGMVPVNGKIYVQLE